MRLKRVGSSTLLFDTGTHNLDSSVVIDYMAWLSL